MYIYIHVHLLILIITHKYILRIIIHAGWLYHTVPGIAGPGEDPNTKATELLKLAVGADAVSSQAWYFLGRCHAAQGRAREAFLAYQQAVSKAVDDDQADIWCSIG